MTTINELHDGLLVIPPSGKNYHHGKQNHSYSHKKVEESIPKALKTKTTGGQHPHATTNKELHDGL